MPQGPRITAERAVGRINTNKRAAAEAEQVKERDPALPLFC